MLGDVLSLGDVEVLEHGLHVDSLDGDGGNILIQDALNNFCFFLGNI